MGTGNEIDLSRAIEFVDISTTEERVNRYTDYDAMHKKLIESLGVPSELYQAPNDLSYEILKFEETVEELMGFLRLPEWFRRELANYPTISDSAITTHEKVNWKEDGF